jgi:hypothetical protein
MVVVPIHVYAWILGVRGRDRRSVPDRSRSDISEEILRRNDRDSLIQASFAERANMPTGCRLRAPRSVVSGSRDLPTVAARQFGLSLLDAVGKDN